MALFGMKTSSSLLWTKFKVRSNSCHLQIKWRTMTCVVLAQNRRRWSKKPSTYLVILNQIRASVTWQRQLLPRAATLPPTSSRSSSRRLHRRRMRSRPSEKRMATPRWERSPLTWCTAAWGAWRVSSPRPLCWIQKRWGFVLIGFVHLWKWNDVRPVRSHCLTACTMIHESRSDHLLRIA